MITIVLTNRNRDLNTIKNCLDSLSNQHANSFFVILIDYGSDFDYANNLIAQTSNYDFVELIQCPVNGQLWNKSKAINIALKRCITPYFFVGDIDMIFDPNFIQKLYEIKNEKEAFYFKVGFLSKEESAKNLKFDDRQVAFSSNEEATGMTLYPTQLLLEINGYDEFYHGWGAEDTDVHIRLKNTEVPIHFYDKEVLIKHQWHPKSYRSKNNPSPFHSKLERINHSYIQFTREAKLTKANSQNEWGLLPVQENYLRLNNQPDVILEIQPSDMKITAVIGQLANFVDKIISISIKDVSKVEKVKNILKKKLGKKHTNYLSMEDVNNRFLEEIILKYRNRPYSYKFDRVQKQIEFKILL